MIQPAAINITDLVKQLLLTLQLFAKANGIELQFQSKEERIDILLRPDTIIHDVTDLVCGIISYTPQGNSITVSVTTEKDEVKLSVANTGINLSCVAELVAPLRQKISVTGNKETRHTQFEFRLPLTIPSEKKALNGKLVRNIEKTTIPEYYDAIRKRLRSHFSKADNLVAQLSILYPKEAAFLQKVNAVITTNMDNEQFDTAALSREMNMSRASLFRRLKPLIHQAPATYIKSIRLQKAKELLETTDITAGEAALKTGFQSQSHFSKAFAETFGFLPSSIRRKNQDATKE